MKKVLIITYDGIPDIDAGAVRDMIFAEMLTDIGYSVNIVSMGETTEFKEKEVNKGITHLSFRPQCSNRSRIVLSYLLFPLRLYLYIRKQDFDVCLYTQIDRISQLILRNYCKRRGSVSVFDAVEWFSPEEFLHGKRSYGYRLNNNYNVKYISSQDRVIAISSYLYDHFNSRGIRTVRIPVMMDIYHIAYRKTSQEDRIMIIYAGSPGRKDNLAIIVKAISLLSVEERERLRFTIIGCLEDDLIEENDDLRGILSLLGNTITFCGRMSRNAVLDLYQNADFSIMIRSESQRYAKAGFPTKFVESLATGTPVICNATSDLDQYLMDGYNGILVKGMSVYDVLIALKRALSISHGQRTEMYEKSRLTAEKCFDYHHFEGVLATIVDKDG